MSGIAKDLQVRHVEFIRAAENAPEGIVEAIVCTYGVVDSYGTIFRKGCFDESIRGEALTAFYGHDYREFPIGVVSKFEDVASDLEGATGALKATFKLNMDVQRGKEAWSLIKQGAIKGFSVGFRADLIEFDDDERVTFVKATLKEVSAVAFPAVPGTKTNSARSAHGQTLGEELESALAAVGAVIERIEAINEARKSENRTASKTHVPKIQDLRGKLSALESELSREEESLELLRQRTKLAIEVNK